MTFIRTLFICATLSFLISPLSYSQNISKNNGTNSGYFVSINYGTQMSGIKDEDFITSNYSPLFNITTGIWFTPYLAMQIGYKGFYFNAIADEIKHQYNYFYSEVVINFNNFVHSDRRNKKWSILMHGGPGYFYNYVYGRASLHLNIGVQNTFQLTSHLHASIDIASIAGWDIYQGNTDILPGILFGLIYKFE